jgi:hypothetical protein
MRRLIQRIRARRAERAPATAEVPTGVPAGVEPEDAAAPHHPSFRERGQLRRRLRYLRRVRELGFRDLGGLVFDQHRFEKPNETLVKSKLDALAAIDGELRALEAALDDRRPLHELREPGVSACPRCGALHGSDANWCPACGLALRGPRAVGGLVAPVPAVDGPRTAREQPTAVAPSAGGDAQT